jgi:hypothetical protein
MNNVPVAVCFFEGMYRGLCTELCCMNCMGNLVSNGSACFVNLKMTGTCFKVFCAFLASDQRKTTQKLSVLNCVLEEVRILQLPNSSQKHCP